MLRGVSLLVIALISLANIASAARLVIDLVNDEGIRDAERLLLTGGSIWLTNVIVFSLWYWEFDRGGPVGRAVAAERRARTSCSPRWRRRTSRQPDWRPEYVDYLYLSFTNAMAFSPTDVMPMSRWTKLTMLLQSLVSLIIAVLVIARRGQHPALSARTARAQRFQMRAALCSTIRSRSASGMPSNSSSMTVSDFGHVDTGCG